jgi:hypothetical protein
MTHTRFHSLILVCTTLGIAAPVLAQQAPAPSATPAAAEAPAAPPPTRATATTAAPTPAAPNASNDFAAANLLKKARKAGYYRKVGRDNVLFCKKEAPLGSRFIDEHCMGGDQLELTLLGQQAQRDQLQHLQGAKTNYQ